jgi:hypothetical protein
VSLILATRLARARTVINRRGRNHLSRFCCVLSGRNLTFIGYNSYKTHPLQARYSKYPHTHAEVDAISKALNYFTKIQGKGRRNVEGISLSGFKLSVARVLGDGTPGLARPCVSCCKAINDFGINHIEWTENTNDGEKGDETQSRPH